MGCTVSAAAAAPPQPEDSSGDAVAGTPPSTEQRSTRSKWALLKGHHATLMATWLELCGSKPGEAGDEEVPTLGRDDLRALFQQLGREMSEDEFSASFERIDINRDGRIQFGEFLAWYNIQTSAEQKKVRALKVEAELRRRLASGELTPEQSKAARSRLALAELVRRLENGELDADQVKAVRARLAVAAALGVPGARLAHAGKSDPEVTSQLAYRLP